ncbi:MAG: oligosaccharide flippase family protein [Planctomycetes bacterium]|nr:oligosaccharide flippase family protein [Planctomycetota bacterium]
MEAMPENIKTSPTIFKRAVKGGWWIFASRIIQQLMAMVRLVVLARILSPEDFGLLGLALLTISV